MFIEPEKYKLIIGLIPIISLDMFIVKDGEVLLGKRTNNPMKEEWCVPGGRLLIGEQIQDGVLRKIKEELGVTYTGTMENLGTYNTIFDINSFGENKPYHTVNIVHIITLDKEYTFHADAQNEELQFFEIKQQPFFPEYINLLIHDYLNTHG